MSHVLITGGAGFIGSKLTEHYVNKGNKVTIIDNLSTGLEQNIVNKVNFINKDITTSNWTKYLPNDITHVFHLAAQSSGEISFDDPVYDIMTNAVATLQLLKWSLENNIKKLIFASSMNVYGDVPDKPITEDYPIAPESFYGVGKVTSENYVRIFSELGLSSTILRLFNVYGPGQNMANLRQGMVSIYCSYVASGKPVIVKGSEERFRDLVYINDVISAFVNASKLDSDFDIFNICSGDKMKVNMLLKKIFNAFGHSDYPYEVIAGTPRDQFGIYGSYNKAKKDLNWKPSFSIEAGLNEMVAWIKEEN